MVEEDGEFDQGSLAEFDSPPTQEELKESADRHFREYRTT
jgi:hypothetical protein